MVSALAINIAGVYPKESVKPPLMKLTSGVLKQLGRVSIDWVEVTEWEAELLKRLINEVEGVPAFVAKMLDQFLDGIIKDNGTKSANTVNGTTSSAVPRKHNST